MSEPRRWEPVRLWQPARLAAWAVAVAVVAVCVATDAPARLSFSPCVFRNLTGLPCPGCGMTRGFVAMGHGRLSEAWGQNALSPLFFVAVCAYVVGFPLCGGRVPSALRRAVARRGRLLLVMVFVLIAASWAVSLVRHFAS